MNYHSEAGLVSIYTSKLTLSSGTHFEKKQSKFKKTAVMDLEFDRNVENDDAEFVGIRFCQEW